MKAADDEATRSIEMEVTVDAPVEAVWDALSGQEGLEQWFPLNARVEPGVGGRIWLSWGPGVEGEGRIEVWEPNRRLAWSERGPAQAGAVPIVVDFELEARGGSTVVRLVHSGFGAAADWDEYYDAVQAGWTYFLFHLAFFLARHRGAIRRMVSARRRTTRTVPEIWRALLGKGGMDVDGAQPGSQYTLRLGDAQHTGRARIVNEKRGFAGTIDTLNDGLLFVEIEPGSPAWHCGVWISLYGVAPDRADALQAALDTLMDGVFDA